MSSGMDGAVANDGTAAAAAGSASPAIDAVRNTTALMCPSMNHGTTCASNYVVYSSEASAYLADLIAQQLSVERGTYLRVLMNEKYQLVGQDVIYVAATHTDDDLLELVRLGCAFAAYGSRRRIFVIPFLGYRYVPQSSMMVFGGLLELVRLGCAFAAYGMAAAAASSSSPSSATDMGRLLELVSMAGRCLCCFETSQSSCVGAVPLLRRAVPLLRRGSAFAASGLRALLRRGSALHGGITSRSTRIFKQLASHNMPTPHAFLSLSFPFHSSHSTPYSSHSPPHSFPLIFTPLHSPLQSSPTSQHHGEAGATGEVITSKVNARILSSIPNSKLATSFSSWTSTPAWSCTQSRPGCSTLGPAALGPAALGPAAPGPAHRSCCTG
ncbi:unnamed protein product, partial [Closterium sp. NIES-64]